MTTGIKHIRPAGPGDAGWVISMHGELYAREFGFDLEFELGIAAKMVDFFKRKDDFTTLFIHDTATGRSGSIGISRQSDAIAFINFLLVLPEYRGRGIGGELLDAVISHSREHGFTSLRLETYSCLEQARQLYRKAGFTMESPTRTMKNFGKEFEQEFWSLTL